MKTSLLAITIFLTINAHADIEKYLDGEVLGDIDYEQPLVVAHPGIGECDFAYDGKQFYIIRAEETTQVKSAFVDKKLRGITNEQLLVFLDGGYLYVNQLDNGDFTITAKGRLRGGILGFLGIGALAVKSAIVGALGYLPPAMATSTAAASGSSLIVGIGSVASVIVKQVAGGMVVLTALQTVLGY